MTTSVVPVRLPPTLLLERAQIAPSHDWLLKHMGGRLYSRVARVFGGANAPLYILATRSRRQVWNACLAVLDKDRDPAQLLADFHDLKSKTLLEQAYGPIPAGFETALRKTGEIAGEPGFYRFWFDYLSRHPEDARIIASLDSLTEEHTSMMERLPAELRRVEFMRAFKSDNDASMFVCNLSTVQRALPETASWSEAARRLKSGERPHRIFRRMLGEVRTPAPFITQDKRFRHLDTVKAIWAAGRIYQNCLVQSDMVDTALSGNEQFYEYDNGSLRCLVSITFDAPFGYRVGSMLGKKNEDVPQHLHWPILRALYANGVMRGVKFNSELRYS